MKKPVLVLSILLVISGLFVGCSDQQVIESNDSTENEEQQSVNGPEADEMALNVVKKLEIFDHSFSNYGILYDSYIDKIGGLFFQGEAPIFSADKHFALTYVAAGEEVKEYTDEQRKAAYAENKNEVTIEGSEVFTEEEKNWKYVYTKATIVDPTKEEGKQTSNIYRRYILTVQDDEWKILILDQFNCEEGTAEEDIKFNKYNNEIVQYTDAIPFLQ